MHGIMKQVMVHEDQFGGKGPLTSLTSCRSLIKRQDGRSVRAPHPSNDAGKNTPKSLNKKVLAPFLQALSKLI